MNNPNKLGLFARISTQDQVLFAKHLAVMTKAGMPIVDSLQILRKQSTSKTMTKILDVLISDVSNGQFLSTSLEKFRNIFGDFAVNIIRVGEASGILYENLNYLADELKKKQELKTKVMGALAYPIIVLVATLGIVGILTIYVFPKILPVFKSMNVDLPITTRILIAVSDYMQVYGIVTIIGIVSFFILLFVVVSKVTPMRLLFHKLLLMTPVAGNISRYYSLSNFSRTLGLLLKSDIKIVEALFITSNTVTNLVYQSNIREIANGVTKGEEISKFIATKPKLFPLTLSEMIAIGERTGNLSESLLYLAGFYESELNEMTKNLSNILEPLLMIVMGVVVGFIALSIITPIYQITANLKVK